MKKLIFILLSLVLSTAVLAESKDQPQLPEEGIAPYKADEVRVYKSKRRIEMLFEGKVVKTYFPHFGKGGLKPKRREGDNLVPEGKYLLDAKNPYSKYYKALHVSYPNEEDILRGQATGVVDLGKDIMIHGYPNNVIARAFVRKKLDWTAGCIAVEDFEMEQIYNSLEVPTPITIYP